MISYLTQVPSRIDGRVCREIQVTYGEVSVLVAEQDERTKGLAIGSYDSAIFSWFCLALKVCLFQVVHIEKPYLSVRVGKELDQPKAAENAGQFCLLIGLYLF